MNLNPYLIVAYMFIFGLILMIMSLRRQKNRLRNQMDWMYQRYTPRIKLSDGTEVTVNFVMAKYDEKRFSPNSAEDFIRIALEATKYGSGNFDERSFKKLLSGQHIHEPVSIQKT